MKLTQTAKRLLFRLMVFCVAILLIWINRNPPEKPPRVVRSLSSSTNDFRVLWVMENIPPLIKTDGEGVIFVTQLYGSGVLESIDVISGSIIWKISLPRELSGMTELLVNKNMVYVVSSTHVNAYEKKDGTLRWSIELGKGHVSIVSQLEEEILRIYYGNNIFEINSKTGKIDRSIPKEDIIWTINNLTFRRSSTGQISAFNERSELIWSQPQPSFFVSDEWIPENAATDVLVIGYQALSSYSLIEKICALNLQNGMYNWCRKESYISNFAIDSKSQLGYIMRDDFVIEVINLKTGEVSEEIHFSPSVLSEEMLRFSHRYFVALSNDVLIVSFSDSDQIFGVSLK